MKIDIIICDMDGTAVKYDNQPFHSSWDALANALPVEKKKRWFGLRDIYLEKGNGFYEQWFNKQVGSLRGVHISEAEKVLFPIPYTKGFKEFFGNLNGIKKVILSAGVDIVAKKILEELCFDYLVSQTLEIENMLFTGKGKSFSRGLDKSEQLLKLSKEMDVDLLKTCYIGDTFTDISCFELVGFPIAFEPKCGLEKYVKEKSIPSIKDFEELYGILKLD